MTRTLSLCYDWDYICVTAGIYPYAMAVPLSLYTALSSDYFDMHSCFTDWSAPSAIGIAGLGGGFEIGAEVN